MRSITKTSALMGKVVPGGISERSRPSEAHQRHHLFCIILINSVIGFPGAGLSVTVTPEHSYRAIRAVVGVNDERSN